MSLQPISKPTTLDETSFDEFVTNAPIALIDFWAEWCGPCKAVGPILNDLAGEYQGKVWVGKLNVDNNRNLAMKFGASSIPTFWAFKEGKPVGRFVGALPKEAFVDVFKQLIDLDMEEVAKQQAAEAAEAAKQQ